jgi:hypothetical protein
MTSTTTTPAPSKLQTILQIIQAALAGLSAVPLIGPDAALASVFLGIFQSATSLYQTETGTPFDITKIPQEAKLP